MLETEKKSKPPRRYHSKYVFCCISESDKLQTPSSKYWYNETTDSIYTMKRLQSHIMNSDVWPKEIVKKGSLLLYAGNPELRNSELIGEKNEY